MLSRLRAYWFPILVLASVAIGVGLAAIEADASGVASQTLVTHNRGQVAAAGVTGTTSGGANTVLTTTTPSVLVAIENTTDAEVMITKGAADFKRVPAGSFRVFDLKTNGAGFSAGVWGVYQIGTPSSGVVEIVAIPYR